MAAAVKAGHPRTLKPPLPEPLQRAVNITIQLGAKGLEIFRNKWSEKCRHVRSNLNLMIRKSKVVCLCAFAI